MSPAPGLGIGVGAEQPDLCVGAEDVVDFLRDGLDLLGAEAYRWQAPAWGSAVFLLEVSMVPIRYIIFMKKRLMWICPPLTLPSEGILP